MKYNKNKSGKMHYMILDNYKEFLDELIKNINEKGIDLSNLYLDHIGYQASSNQDYDNLKSEFDKIGKLISEEIVGGRCVGVYKFNSPLIYNGKEIPAIELVAPKEGQVCPSALEHCEFVLDTDFETFVKKYPNVNFDTSKISQPTFPMVTLKLSDTTQVKFHLKPVLEIVGEK